MPWPVPVNVRLSPLQAGVLMNVTAGCADDEREIDDFPEYATDLTPGQTVRLDGIAREIVRSHDTQSPVAAVLVVGHADRALRVPEHERAAKEKKVSEERARLAHERLLQAIRRVPGGGPVAAMLHVAEKAMGATQLAVQQPLNEQQMRRNRRVVFKWQRCVMPNPIPKRLPELPPPTPRDPEDDPNVVFAGNRFRLKILDGASAGEVLGVFSYHMALWDVVNKRLAEYTYRGVIGTIGVPPFTECGESDFSNEFTTTTFEQVDQFSCTASHTSGSLGVASGMLFTFTGPFRAAKVEFPTGGKNVSIFAGPSKSLGVETAKSGSFSLIPGSVRVFKGP